MQPHDLLRSTRCVAVSLNATSRLLRERFGSFHLKCSRDRWCAGIRLTSADGHRELPFSNDRFAGFCDDAQVSVFHIELHCLRLAGLQMNTFESTQRAQRSTLYVRE